MSDSSLQLEHCAAQVHELAESVWSKGSPEDDARRAVALFEEFIASI